MTVSLRATILVRMLLSQEQVMFGEETRPLLDARRELGWLQIYEGPILERILVCSLDGGDARQRKTGRVPRRRLADPACPARSRAMALGSSHAGVRAVVLLQSFWLNSAAAGPKG